MTIGRSKGLDALINKNPAHKDYPVGGRTIADTIEAIIGAVYVDSNSNVKVVKEVMRNLDMTPELLRKSIMEVGSSESVESPAVDSDEGREGAKSAPMDSNDV